jgi:hypothetical protein
MASVDAGLRRGSRDRRLPRGRRPARVPITTGTQRRVRRGRRWPSPLRGRDVDRLLGVVRAPTTEGVRQPELGASRWAAAAMKVPTASTTEGPLFDRQRRVDEHGQAAFWWSQWICDVSAPLARSGSMEDQVSLRRCSEPCNLGRVHLKLSLQSVGTLQLRSTRGAPRRPC